MAGAVTTSLAGDQRIDGLLQAYKWDTTNLTFSFPQSIAAWSGYSSAEPTTNFEPLTSQAVAAVRNILSAFASFSGLTFTESTASSGALGDLRFGMTDGVKDGFPAFAYGPSDSAVGGDSWYKNSGSIFDAPVVGTYAYATFMHEIGHALGLKHGHDYDGAGALPNEYNSTEYSIMTYRSYEGQGLPPAGVYTNEQFGFPQTPMMLDIAAIQHLYGANFAHNSTNTEYRWLPGTGTTLVNGQEAIVPGANRIFITLWDGGGTDTYNLSGFSTSVSIDLRPGKWTITSAVQRANLGDGHVADGNIANALLYQGDTRSLIENARGGSAADQITGNDAANQLNGGRGADWLSGGLGNDTYVVDNASDQVVESAGGGTDIVRSSASKYLLAAFVENLILTGSGSIAGTGNGLANVITGNGGANKIDGGGGADTMAGGNGGDTYIVDVAGDRIEEDLAATGTDRVVSHISYTLGAALEALTLAGTAAISGTGNASANSIVGNSASNTLDGGGGNDVLDGAGGTDTMKGGAGDDTYAVDASGDQVVETSAADGTDTVASAIGYSLGNHIERLVLTGSAAINGTGNALANMLTGNAAANVLNGAAGADAMAGGAGNDTYVVDVSGDVVTEAASAGSDTVRSLITYILPANVEKLILDGSAEINGTGNASENSLTGNAAANTLDGKEGADTMAGGKGNDTYVVDNALDKVVESSATGGTDRVLSAVSFTLGLYVDQLVLTGTAAIDGTGNGGANSLTGNAAANRLDGGGGVDTMRGGGGNDIYVVDNRADLAIESSATGGADKVMSSASFTLGTYIEELVLTGMAAIDGTGHAGANIITGNEASNVIDGKGGADRMTGGGGDDTYFVDHAGDVVVEAFSGIDTVKSTISYTLPDQVEHLVLLGVGNIHGTGNSRSNWITGNSGANQLAGLGGADRLDGGAGADTMSGGTGADTYFVDNAGDSIVEVAGDLIDIVYSSVSYALAADVENLVLTGQAVEGRGNALANMITGNDAANILYGTGNDILTGGLGNDIYHITGADLISTKGYSFDAGGTDTVHADYSFTLLTTLEHLVLTGSANIDGTGSELDNIIIGNAGNNRLFGRAGSDMMQGGAGNDYYEIDNAGDTAVEFAGEGIDTVIVLIDGYTLPDEIEDIILLNLVATGNGAGNVITASGGNNILSGLGGDDTLLGGDGADALDGGADADTLNGGRGIDRLIGGAGADRFQFDDALRSSNSHDEILDFSSAEGDKIWLDGAFFGLPAGALAGNHFRVGSAFTGPNDKLLWDAPNGRLYYDADGSGFGSGATLLAILTPNAPLAASDIIIY